MFLCSYEHTDFIKVGGIPRWVAVKDAFRKRKGLVRSFLPLQGSILVQKFCSERRDLETSLACRLEVVRTFWKIAGLPRIPPNFPKSSPATSQELLKNFGFQERTSSSAETSQTSPELPQTSPKAIGPLIGWFIDFVGLK